MNKNIIISVIVAIIVLTGLLWWGRPNQKPAQSETVNTENTEAKSVLVASEKLYDFGTISMKNGDVTKEFTVTNPTDQDIVVPSLVTSCMCTKAFIVKSNGKTKGPFGMPGMGYVPPANETIKAGESRIIRVVYDPNAHGPAGVGQIDRFIILTEASGGRLELEIKALVTP
ncbi:MAG: hypothetical protein A2370_01560 [Candidatus Vogelbacteria bacterium RIFOXYB1_FULL_42_16]|uniref:DUF1573 domain-containing protein n=1 Tax=Candidatus Vogelbacteria bacterium RIFOXYB1_FULL_42_16 TaxID=1802436 RepID=A0A1G2QEG6_9BACT|nr:MAG: hypothetical protein A2370_01560 [Candidatus Vogelbacteria bacterium RIFOXYB1_FULL_42_16]